MNSFFCEHCGAHILDTPIGYITGCKHYPLPLARDHSTLKQLLTEAIELLRNEQTDLKFTLVKLGEAIEELELDGCHDNEGYEFAVRRLEVVLSKSAALLKRYDELVGGRDR